MSDHTAKLTCIVCRKPTLLTCSQCNTAYYCSEQHQLIDRSRHLAECKEIAFSRNLIDLEGINTRTILEYRRLYIIRNSSRREAAQHLLAERLSDAMPYVHKSRLLSRELLLKDTRVQLFFADLLLDCLLEVYLIHSGQNFDCSEKSRERV